MPVKSHTAAVIVVEIPLGKAITVRLSSRGDLESVRQVLRKSCSKRRRIVIDRQETFCGNVIKCLLELGYDIGSLTVGRAKPDPNTRFYHRIFAEIDRPPLVHSSDNGEDLGTKNFFDFIGPSWKRDRSIKPRARKKSKLLRLYEKLQQQRGES